MKPTQRAPLTQVILALNAGSSSLKFALHPLVAAGSRALIRGRIEGIGSAPDFLATDVHGHTLAEGGMQALEAGADHRAVTRGLLDWLATHHDGMAIVAAGHRVVHGGRHHGDPVRIDPAVMEELRSLVSLAPQHQPHNLAAIDALAARVHGLVQVACFDTGFHRTQQALAQTYALPRALTQRGIVGYGFHGLSYAYIASVLPAHLGALADGRIVVAHLGNGASLCAMRERRSVATTMGFSTLDGLMMGRRPGSIDPGVLLHLMRHEGWGLDAVEHMLYSESGLLGVSGIGNDLRDLQRSTEPSAREALALYAYRAAGEIARMACALQGIDALVFTAGIGENSADMRARIAARLQWLGVVIDERANLDREVDITAAGSAVRVLVVPTDEEQVIVEATRKLTGAQSASA